MKIIKSDPNFKNQVEEIEKKDFDKYILHNYDENRIIKN